jgi:hypothetical protein
LKPEVWSSPEVMNLSHSARLLFLGLITQADDEGIGSADIRKLKAVIFGGDEVTHAELGSWLEEIERQRLAVLYEVDGYGRLYFLPSWTEHQRVPKPTPTRYAKPVDNLLPERYRNATGTLPGDRKDRKEGREGSDRATGTRLHQEVRASGAQPRGPSPEAVAEAVERNRRTLERTVGPVLAAMPR